MLKLLLLLIGALCYAIPNVQAHLNFILVGATGNLANKYLWQGLLAHMIEGNVRPESISIFAGATRSQEEGDKLVSTSIANTKCYSEEDSDSGGLWDYSKSQCDAGKAQLVEASQYVKLKNYADYAALDETIGAANLRKGAVETTRVFYLSISPSLYEATVLAVHETGRPVDPAQLRVVFEKPFGRDHDSALALSQLLQKHLSESEIYRVDHYLGKEGLQAIAGFRRLNLELLHALQLPDTGALTEQCAADTDACAPDTDTGVDTDTDTDASEHHTAITVSLLETEDVQGRSAYYDEYGVVRDVMQNHMTQALVYAMMEFPPPGGDNGAGVAVYGHLGDRLAVLERLGFDGTSAGTSADAAATGVGNAYWCAQYADYVSHVQTDMRNASYVSDTCTAARVRLQYTVASAAAEAAEAAVATEKERAETSRSRKVANRARARMAAAEAQLEKRRLEAQRLPTRDMNIQFWAGKAAHVRTMDVTVATGDCSITYNVQGTGTYIALSGVCWTNSKHPVRLPRGWVVRERACSPSIRTNIHQEKEQESTSEVDTDGSVCTLEPAAVAAAAAGDTRPHNNAYIRVLAALLRDDKSMFVPTAELLAQWKLWDQVIDSRSRTTETESVTKYPKGAKLSDYV